MQIGDKETTIICFLNTILSDKEDNYYLVSPELTGSVKMDVGNGKKKKYQFINGDICIPYSCIKDEYKENMDVISKSTLKQYMFIKKDYMNDEVMNKHIKDTENDLHSFYEKNPKVEIALKELLEALKEAKY